MKRELLSEEVDQIINQSFWNKGGLKITESAIQDQSDDDEDAEVISEEQEHTCPLCESHIETAISDDKLVEHIGMFLDIINQIDGITDDEIDAIREAVEEELASEDSDDNAEDDDAEDDDEQDDSEG